MRRINHINKLQKKNIEIRKEIQQISGEILHLINKYLNIKSVKYPLFYSNQPVIRNDIVRRIYCENFYFDWQDYFNLQEIIFAGNNFSFRSIQNIKLDFLFLKDLKKIKYEGENFSLKTIKYRSTDISQIHEIPVENLILENISNFQFRKYFYSRKKIQLQFNNIKIEDAISFIEHIIKCEIEENDFHYYYFNNILIFDNIFILHNFRDLKYLRVKDSSDERIYELILHNKYIEWLIFDNVIINRKLIGHLSTLKNLRYLGLQNNNIDIFTICNILRPISKSLRYLNLSNVILPYDFIHSIKKIVRNCTVIYNDNRIIKI